MPHHFNCHYCIVCRCLERERERVVVSQRNKISYESLARSIALATISPLLSAAWRAFLVFSRWFSDHVHRLRCGKRNREGETGRENTIRCSFTSHSSVLLLTLSTFQSMREGGRSPASCGSRSIDQSEKALQLCSCQETKVSEELLLLLLEARNLPCQENCAVCKVCC